MRRLFYPVSRVFDTGLASKSTDTHHSEKEKRLVRFYSKPTRNSLDALFSSQGSPFAQRWQSQGGEKPFTLKLLYGSSGYKQNMCWGMDCGYANPWMRGGRQRPIVGISRRQTPNRCLEKDATKSGVSKGIAEGAKPAYHKTPLAQSCESAQKGRIHIVRCASKIESHLREKKQVESILPITRWKVETASFDIHRPHEPRSVVFGLSGSRSKGILQREGNTHGPRWVSLPIGAKSGTRQGVASPSGKVFRSQGGTDTPDNLVQCAEDTTRICMLECLN